jgi:hypothetical protein
MHIIRQPQAICRKIEKCMTGSMQHAAPISLKVEAQM